jgi:hypothetical protein
LCLGVLSGLACRWSLGRRALLERGVPVRLVSGDGNYQLLSYDLGVRANTLQYITPWPGDKIRHITPTSRWARRFQAAKRPNIFLFTNVLAVEWCATVRENASARAGKQDTKERALQV